MSHDGTVKGYAAYKVADNVKNHYAVGLGSYDVFIYTNGASIFMDNAYEVPNTENVIIENCCITEISMADGPAVGNHGIINGFGPGISTGSGGNGYAVQAVTYYCNGKGVALPDFYERKGDKADITEADTTTEEDIKAPSADPKAEEDTSVISISSISFKDRDDAYPVVIETGKSEKLELVFDPEAASKRVVTWRIQDSSIASVDQTGKVTGLKAGKTVLTATAGGKTAQITISVVDVAVTGLEILNRSEIENGLKTGESIMMDVQVNPADATDQDLVFRTSNKKIASVNKDGIVTGHKAGSTIITAQAGDQTAEVTVHVVNTELESIDVANQQSEMFVGENWKMQMKVVPEKAPLSSMEFSCSPSTVASVDGKGKVTALSEGNALITIRLSVTPQSDISAQRMQQLFTFESSNPGVLAIDASGNMAAVAEGSAEVTVTAYNGKFDRRTITVTGSGTVTWKSSNEAAAAVDANGTITGVGAGRTTISATVGGSTQSMELQVVKPTVKWNVSYKTVPLQLKNKKKVNKTTVLQPTGLQDGDFIQTYKSSKKSVATVKKSSKGKLTITPKKVGKTKITVTTRYGAEAAGQKTHPVYEEANADRTVQYCNLGQSVTARYIYFKCEENNATDTEGKKSGIAMNEIEVFHVENIVPAEILAAPSVMKLTSGSPKGTIRTMINPVTADNQNVVYESSNENVATVSEDGVVQGISSGEATIRATVEGTGVSTDIRVQMFKSIPAAQNVKVTKTNRSDHNVVITWDPVNDAEKYIVRRYKGNSAIPVELGTVTATSYTDSAIEPGEYSWQIVAVPSDKNYTDNSVSNRTNSVIIPKDAQGLSCEPVQMPCKCCSGKGRFSRDMEYI